MTGLGDRVAKALELAGVTPEVVTDWLGVPCGCEERKDKLNSLGFWAERVLRKGTDKASEYLGRIMGR